MIELVIVSFVAGILTVLAPCILPLLPVVIGGSSLHSESKQKQSLMHPIIIVLSLVVSVTIFTLLLKSSTLLLVIPSSVWSTIAGGIILLFGVNLIFPGLWDAVAIRTGLQVKSNQLLAKSHNKNPIKKDMLLGAALGPVFNSCSPTYALIIAVILPASFAQGFTYLIAYSLGLGAILLLISIFGRTLVNKMKWMSNPNGWFQKTTGVIFIVVGLVVVLGIDKQIQTFVLDRGWYDPIMKVERAFH